MSNFDIFLAFVPELRPLLDSDDVSEINVNSEACVFTERAGVRHLEPIMLTAQGLKTACERAAWKIAGVELGREHPIVDTRLQDGSRVAICCPPVSVDGYTLTIRRHHRRFFQISELVLRGMMPQSTAVALIEAVDKRENILISGATGTGKTTLLNALAALIPADQRVIVIEDTTEIDIPHPNQRRFEAQPGVATVDDILKATLRHGPDRILLGEIRGPEAWTLLQLLNTGSGRGSICTLHSDSAAAALRRFSSCVMMAGIEIPYAAIRSDIAESIRLVIHLRQHQGKREVEEVVRVKGYNHATDRYELDQEYERTIVRSALA